LGVIHKGHEDKALNLLAPYLPSPGSSGSAYSEGGSLYALGLMHANHGSPDIIKFLRTTLQSVNGNEIVTHGGCLGLGLASMATANNEVYEDLKNILYMDSAVAGQAAGLAMGLVMMGTANSETINEMTKYAHDTEHEKIILGVAIGLSIVMYGREEEADPLIEQLSIDKDSLLRYGAMLVIGMAYAGTANNSAIRKLLHVAVSDVSDDVRRAAVISLGFLLFNHPEQCPKVVSLLAESYNPHVRYGACMALGISCAGLGLPEAVRILEPLLTDTVGYVRQGAYIAMAMILIQHTSPKAENFRKTLEEKIVDQHEETVSKMGYIIASGILDAGGRNVTIGLTTKGHKNSSAVVGLLVFTQYWYWHPLIFFSSLAFKPTSFIGLTIDLKMPQFNFRSNSPPSTFGYPPKTIIAVKPPPTKLSTAILSISKKQERKDKDTEKKEKERQEALDLEKKKKEEKRKRKKERKTELPYEIKPNGSRVMKNQVSHLTFMEDTRFVPVRLDGGITLLYDKNPNKKDDPMDQVQPISQQDQQKDKDTEPTAPPEFDLTALTGSSDKMQEDQKNLDEY